MLIFIIITTTITTLILNNNNLPETRQVEAAKLEKTEGRVEGEHRFLSQEAVAIERESVFADNTTNKWTDSTRENGIPQRFLTKYLRIRLHDVLKNTQVREQ